MDKGEDVDGIELAETGGGGVVHVTCLSDSSPGDRSENHMPSENEANLA